MTKLRASGIPRNDPHGDRVEDPLVPQLKSTRTSNNMPSLIRRLRV